MNEVSHDSYLGDIISADGRNEKTVKQRVGRGIGIINDIMNILGKVSLGEHYFSIAILLRESLFINSVLSSSEVWYGITKQEMKDLENLDLSLLRRILNAPFSVPAEALYLELGILNLETIIKARRLNYLHYLATRNINEMKCTVGDWCLQGWTYQISTYQKTWIG